ncbi:MAG: ATP--guanido phosphotransferase [Elusimicrobia bacterium CG_4_10_14_3_um_filter_49_12_50_7]|nr:MAG: ATP--guanido phosphotransferase [Elusimicrobia bacterium CG03_land_8_20_14_0_80_50_18]PIX15241.1 MAG: ATP--guanido phosphotransferase [Elusimicrobia bacterium CG_4_8_14_3_um_filter_50_9]PIY18143.1 MAG: ATP--guanido phosphotransferase [Elusimicrobia bacterium CG_4_10_14_3_um_filter_49_12_50_7]
MIFSDLASKSISWQGPEPGSHFVSTRVRFARNLKGHYFPCRAGAGEQLKVRKEVFEGLRGLPGWKSASRLELEELDISDRKFLIERHLASYDLVFTDRVAGLVMGDDAAIMVNEEDHLRIQVLGPGLSLQESFEKASVIVREISAAFDFAQNDEFGFLTTCPTNAGTGLRISFLAHLPSLVLSGYIGEVIDSLARVGVASRGVYGEATKPLGGFFQISNQVTLGVTGKEIIDKLTAISKQLEDASDKAMDELVSRRKTELEDRIYRSYGVIQYARRISYEELISRISDIRLGLSMGMALPMGGDRLNDMLFLSQPAHIEQRNGSPLSPDERDEKRAEFLREIMG